MTTDTGTTWSIVNTGLTELNINSLLSVGTNLFVGTENSGVFLSTNSGTSWKPVNQGLTNMNVKALTVNGSYIFAGTFGNGVWRRPLSDFGSSSVNAQPVVTGSMSSFPNPFPSKTAINITLPESGYAEISIVNLLGQEVARLFDGELTEGPHTFTWDAISSPPGSYWCIARMGGNAEQRIALSVQW